MNHLQDDKMLDYVDRYLRGQLPRDEARNFEASFEKDKELKDYVKQVLRAKASIYLAGKQTWQEELEKRFKQGPEEKPFLTPPLLTLVATVIVFLLIGFWWIQQNRIPTAQEIFSEYSYLPEAPEFRGENIDSLVISAYTKYNLKQYASALADFEILLADSQVSPNQEVLFFYSMTHIAMRQEEQALTLLPRITEAQYAESATFLRALLLDKHGNRSKAKSVMMDIINMGGTLQAKAQEIVEIYEEQNSQDE